MPLRNDKVLRSINSAPVAAVARYFDVAPYPHIGVEQFPDRRKPLSVPRSEKDATIFFHRPLAKAFHVKMNIVPSSGTIGDYLSSHRGAIRNTFSNPFQTLLEELALVYFKSPYTI
jgi:hypothetical protein